MSKAWAAQSQRPVVLSLLCPDASQRGKDSVFSTGVKIGSWRIRKKKLTLLM